MDDERGESKEGDAGSREPDWLDADPRQAEVFAEFLAEMDGSWVWLSRSDGEVGDHSVGQYSALLTPERVAAGVSDPGWDVHHGGGHPGFVSYNSEAGWTTDYVATSDEGVELLVIDRTWHGVRPGDQELAQEFRLLFNLWEDRATRTFYDFDGSGNPIKSVVIEDRGVRALVSLVRRYQAAKQMYLALYLDSTLWSAELPNEDHDWETRDAHLICGYYRSTHAVMDDRPFSGLLGKRLFAPPPRELCGIAPFERAKTYEEFVIATNDVGEEVLFTFRSRPARQLLRGQPRQPALSHAGLLPPGRAQQVLRRHRPLQRRGRLPAMRGPLGSPARQRPGGTRHGLLGGPRS